MSANKKKLLQPDKILILDTQLVKCNINCPFGFSPSQNQKYDYNLDFELAFNLDDSLAKADFKLNISTVSNEDELNEASGDFHFVYIYKIENLNELVVVHDKNKGIELDGSLGNALASITYSTSRGILFARLKGTGLENFVLPVIDPNSLLKTNEDSK